MAKQKRGKPYLSLVADRRLSSNLLKKPFNGRTMERVVADPKDGLPILVDTNIRDDAFGRMEKRGNLKTHQIQAGRHLQEQFEYAGIGVKASDTTKEFVDGAGAYVEAITDRQQKAVKAIARAREKLGERLYVLARDILGANLMIEQVASARGLTTAWEKALLGAMFREALDDLADVFGFSSRAPEAKRVRDQYSELSRNTTNPKLHAAIRLAREAA